MQVRRLGQLKRIQSELLDEYRQQRAAGKSDDVADTGLMKTSWLIGRVSQVVSSDPQLGAHLLVILQKFSGTPPTASDATTTERVYYPVPGRQVSAYSVNDHVLLQHPTGAAFASVL